MSWLSSLVKRNKGVIRKLGKGIDFAADFLPPGFREVGNLGGKLIQGQNLKKAAIGTALDYGIGRITKGLSRKVPLTSAGKVASSTGSTAATIGGNGIFSNLPGVAIERAPSWAAQAAGAVSTAASQGGGNGIIEGVKRALGGASITDLAKGAATAYDVYGREKDRSTVNARNDRDDARQARIDTLNEADRLRDQGLEDTDRRLAAQELQRRNKLQDESLQRDQFANARTNKLEDERLQREMIEDARNNTLEDTDRATKETERLRQLGIFNQDRTADADWFNSLAPFRTQGAQGLLNPAKVDYSGIFAQPRPLPRQIVTPDYAVLSAKRRPLNR